VKISILFQVILEVLVVVEVLADQEVVFQEVDLAAAVVVAGSYFIK
jgi:hypothetical protein